MMLKHLSSILESVVANSRTLELYPWDHDKSTYNNIHGVSIYFKAIIKKAKLQF